MYSPTPTLLGKAEGPSRLSAGAARKLWCAAENFLFNVPWVPYLFFC
jgi:hypothetical protein